MRTRRFVVALALVVAAAAALYAKKNQEKWLDEAFTKWNAQQVRTILGKSAWSQTKAFRGQVQGEHGDFNPGNTGTANGATLGTDVTSYEFTATFFSALPVREAYVRLFQLENQYDSLPAAKKQEFDQKMDVLLHADVSQEVTINLKYQVNDANAIRDMNQWFNTQTTDTLNQNAYLYTNAGQIILSKYLPPAATHGFGARFIFPRLHDGEPIVSAAGGKLRFQLSWQPQIGQTMYIDFKPEEMMYQGQLSY
jgi:hypothetical protein